MTDAQPPKNGIARKLYELARDNPDRIEEAFERARKEREEDDDE